MEGPGADVDRAREPADRGRQRAVRGLPVFVGSPASDGAVRESGAGVVGARADLDDVGQRSARIREGPRGRVEAPPAADGSVAQAGAGEVAARADLDDVGEARDGGARGVARLTVDVVAPAPDEAAARQRAGVLQAGADLDDTGEADDRGRRGAAGDEVGWTPAPDGLVAQERAGVSAARADLRDALQPGDGRRRRSSRRLAVAVRAPAADAPVSRAGAGVIEARADLDRVRESSDRGRRRSSRRLAVDVQAPAADRAVAQARAGVLPACAHLVDVGASTRRARRRTDRAARPAVRRVGREVDALRRGAARGVGRGTGRALTSALHAAQAVGAFVEAAAAVPRVGKQVGRDAVAGRQVARRGAHPRGAFLQGSAGSAAGPAVIAVRDQVAAPGDLAAVPPPGGALDGARAIAPDDVGRRPRHVDHERHRRDVREAARARHVGLPRRPPATCHEPRETHRRHDRHPGAHHGPTVAPLERAVQRPAHSPLTARASGSCARPSGSCARASGSCARASGSCARPSGSCARPSRWAIVRFAETLLRFG